MSRACSWRSRAASSSALTGIRMKSSAPISGSRPETRAHLDAEQDARGDQLGPLPQAPDRVAPDLQVLARLDEHDVDGPLQLGEVVADDFDRVPSPRSIAAGASFCNSFRLGSSVTTSVLNPDPTGRMVSPSMSADRTNPTTSPCPLTGRFVVVQSS